MTIDARTIRKLSVERKSAETEPLHWTNETETVALCGAENQRPANKTERHERHRCGACVCANHELDEDEGVSR